jgi:hypothetical protein
LVGRAVLFAATAVPGGGAARLTYTTGHLCDDVDSTVPDSLADALRAKAAAAILRARANATAGDEDSTIAADMVNHGTKSDRYAKRARDLEAQWDAAVASVERRGAMASSELPNRYRRLIRPERGRR